MITLHLNLHDDVSIGRYHEFRRTSGGGVNEHGAHLSCWATFEDGEDRRVELKVTEEGRVDLPSYDWSLTSDEEDAVAALCEDWLLKNPR